MNTPHIPKNVLLLKPNHADAYCNMGVNFLAQGKLD